jgi:hypothetical protein
MTKSLDLGKVGCRRYVIRACTPEGYALAQFWIYEITYTGITLLAFMLVEHLLRSSPSIRGHAPVTGSGHRHLENNLSGTSANGYLPSLGHCRLHCR